MTKYDDFLEEIKRKHDTTANDSINKLYQLLKEEDKNLSKDDMYDRIMKDCLEIWQKRTILENMPDELKDRERQEAGRKGSEKKKEIVVTTDGSVAAEVAAKNTSESQTESKSQTFETTPIQEVKEEWKPILEQREKVIEYLRLESEKKAKEIQIREQELNKKNQEIEQLRKDKELETQRYVKLQSQVQQAKPVPKKEVVVQEADQGTMEILLDLRKLSQVERGAFMSNVRSTNVFRFEVDLAKKLVTRIY